MATELLLPGAAIVLERTGRLAVLLRRWLPTEVRLAETRSSDECEQAIHQWPASVVLIELALGRDGELARPVERCVSLLERIAARHRQAAAIILAERAFSPIEDLLLEAGAKQVLLGLRDLDRLALWIAARSQFWRKPLTLRQEILQSLPWNPADA